MELEVRKRNFTLITQNVDGLHDLAGNGKILKLHGDIWRMRCIKCGSNWPDRRARYRSCRLIALAEGWRVRAWSGSANLCRKA